MSKKIKRLKVITLFLLLLIGTVPYCNAIGLGEMDPYDLVTVIANKKSVGEGKKVSLPELKLILTMRLKNWDNGDPVTLIIMKDCYCTRYVIKDILKYSLEDYLNMVVFAMKNGGANNIMIVGDAYQLIERVSTIPGAVGIVYSSSLYASDVKNYGTISLQL